MSSAAEPRVSFDGQANAYEERAGLPESICREIVSLLLEGVGPGITVVDVGAGTGTIGRHLIAAPSEVRYVGLDVSGPMLAEFSRSLPSGVEESGRARLLQVDADSGWPMKDHSADVILFSRSAHLLDGERTLADVRRIAAPGCRLFVGRVRRPRDSFAEEMKRTMQQLLRARNIASRNGQRAKRDFLETFERHGARALSARMTSSWSEHKAPIDSIIAWQGKDGLGGRVVSDELKQEVLAELAAWARDRFGDLATVRELAQHYELEGVQFAE